MKKNFLILSMVVGLPFLFNACTTYLIPVDSFRQQFVGVDSTNLKQVKVIGPYGETYTYSANPIEIIQCVDKNGNPHELENKPSIEIRFTYGTNNKRTILYFDRVFVNDSIIVGARSRFIQSMMKTIPLNEVSKIEIQDGKKNFRYIDR